MTVFSFFPSLFIFLSLGDFAHHPLPLPPPVFHSWAAWLSLAAAAMDDKGSVGKISVSSDSVSTLNSEDFVLVSRLGDETPSSTNNGSDDEKTGLKVRMVGCLDGWNHKGEKEDLRAVPVKSKWKCWIKIIGLFPLPWLLQWQLLHGQDVIKSNFSGAWCCNSIDNHFHLVLIT